MVDYDGKTLLDESGNAIRDDWKEYSARSGHVNPLDSELVLEYEVYPNGKKIPRLKIGDGVHEFADLEYMSVDSFILPTPAYVYLNSEDWEKASDDRYYQVVTVHNATITSTSKVDLQPDSAMLGVFHQKDLAFVAENEDGVVSVYCVGQVPKDSYTIQVTVTELATSSALDTINGYTVTEINEAISVAQEEE